MKEGNVKKTLFLNAVLTAQYNNNAHVRMTQNGHYYGKEILLKKALYSQWEQVNANITYRTDNALNIDYHNQ